MSPTTGASWLGPTTADMLATHTLGYNVIARHNDPCPVFDGPALAFLRAYVADPTPATSSRLLQEHGIDDPNSDDYKGSLVGHIILRELKGEVLLDKTEKEALRQWFGAGGADERIQNWKDGKET